MSRKQFQLFISVLLTIIILLGQLLSLSQFLPLKAAERETPFVSLKIDGQTIDSKETVTTPTLYLEVTAKQTGFYALAFDPEVTVITPLESMESLLPLEAFKTFEQETFDVGTWQTNVFTETTKSQTETATTTDSVLESSTIASDSSVVDESSTHEAFLPFQTTSEDGKAGTFYFYLEKGTTQTLKMTHGESSEQVVQLEMLPVESEEPQTQLLYTYQMESEITASSMESEVASSDQLVEEKDSSSNQGESSEESAAEGDGSLLDAVDPLDQNSLGKFNIATEKDVYLIGEEAVGYFELDINQETSNLTIEIRIPKKYLKDAPRGSEFESIVPEEAVLDGDDYLIRYQVPSLTAGYSSRIPFLFHVRAGMTPDGYELPITAKILDSNQQELAQSESEVLYTKQQPEIKKEILKDDGEWAGANGHEIPHGPDHPVRYRFKFNNRGLKTDEIGQRTYESWTVEDTIPDGAVFRQEDNPGWMFDAATRTAKYQGTLDYTDYEYSYGEGDSEQYTPELRLYFPDSKINERVTNKGTATFDPYQKRQGEEHPKAADDINHTLIEYNPFGGYGFIKEGGHENYDTLDEKRATTVKWVSSMTNPSTTDAMEQLRIRDYDQDDQLMFKTLQVTTTDKGTASSPNYDFIGTVTVRIILENGTEQTLSTNYVPKSYEHTVGNNVSSILNLPSDTKEVIVTSNRGATLSAGGSLFLRLNSVYRDPVKTTLDDPTVRPRMSNDAESSGKYVSQSEILTGLSTSSHKLIPVNPTLWIGKYASDESKILLVGDKLTYDLYINQANGVANQWVKKPVVVDLLPEGFEYIPNTSEIDHFSSRYFDYELAEGTYATEPEVIPNYEGTGRTALRWRLPEWAYVGEMIYDDYWIPYHITYETKVTKLAKEGRNTNHAYLGWKNNDEIRSEDETNDIYDINENGNRTDKISGDKHTVDYRPPIELITTKEVMGNLDNGYLFTPMSGKTEIASEGSYRLRLVNNSERDFEHLQLLDVLPHVGDTTVSKDDKGNTYPRESEFPVSLAGPITVPSGFKVFYSLELAPQGSDYGAFYQQATWQTTVTDYTAVRAIKIVMDAGKQLRRGDRLEVEVPLKVAKNYDLTSGQFAVNSFGVSTDNPSTSSSHHYFESNNAAIEIVRYEVSGHVFQDSNRDSELGSAESRFANHTVALVDDEGNPVLDLEGQPITAKTDAKGYFFMDVYRQGKYRVKILPPSGFAVTEPKAGETMSNIYLDQKEHMSDAFELTPANRKAIRNGGYYQSALPIYLYKYDASSVVDSNGNGVIDDAERRNGTPLAGAVFEVYEGTVVDPAKKLKNEDGTPLQLTTDTDGKASFPGQLGGDYVLVEIKAPNGFELLKEPIVLKNINTESNNEIWIYIGNDVQTQLPFTGSNRPFEYLLMTFTSFFLIGMLAIAYQWRPGRHKGGE